MLKSDKTICGILVTQLSHASEKRVILVCDSCGKENETTWANYNNAQRKRGNSGETFCKLCAIRKNGLARRGKPVKISPSRVILCGSASRSWRGGRYIDAHGYVMIHYPITGKRDRSGWSSYRKEHVVVMEQALGRRLLPGDVIHHKNGVKQDNRITNLFLTNHAGHRDAHVSLQRIGFDLVKNHLVDFDDKTGTYYVADKKLRELLEQPGEANQQPSFSGNTLEGSETRSESNMLG